MNLHAVLLDFIETANDLIKSLEGCEDPFVAFNISCKKIDETISDLRKRVIQDESLLKNILTTNPIGEINSIPDIANEVSNYISLFKTAVAGMQFDQIVTFMKQVVAKSNIILDGVTTKPIVDKLIGDLQKIIIVGPNGAGKSALAQYLKQSVFHNFKVIPATKFLYLHHYTSVETFKATRSDVSHGQLNAEVKSDAVKKDRSQIINAFTLAISALCNDHADYCVSLESNNDTISTSAFNELKNIWMTIYPDIQIEVSASERTLRCIKDGHEFGIDGLSDGERASIFFLANALMAESNSIIVVDEPETHLSDNNAVRLWRNICEAREDCKYIFISHNLNFITNVGKADIVWCKEYGAPMSWKLENIEAGRLPLDLIVQITSSQKPILYCEGRLDREVFENLFGDEFTIIEVGGQNNVINYSKLHQNHSSLSSQKCCGIIDRDNLSSEEIGRLKENNIYVLKQNEIEMLLLEDIILEHVMKSIHCNDASGRIRKFKEEFFRTLDAEKQKIALMKLKSSIELHNESEKITNFKSKIDLINSIIHLINSTFDYNGNQILGADDISAYVNDLIKAHCKEIERIAKNEDYSGALEICNLKGEISKGLANKYLDNDFIEKCIKHLKNEELRDSVRNAFFPDILTNL